MARFRQERRQTMRDDWRWLAATLAVTVGLAAWLAVAHGWPQILASFLLGAYAVVLFVGWLIGFDAHSLRWRWGAAGEEWTADELSHLGAEWRVFHDLPNSAGNWDHIAVGPPGIFAIDSKNLTQPATVEADGLRSGRLRYGGATSRGSAVRLKKAIEQEAGLAVWVQGVVAVWGRLSSGAIEINKVLYVPASQLVPTLSVQPTRLAEAERMTVIVALETLASTRR
jgi:hypothetical protein